MIIIPLEWRPFAAFSFVLIGTAGVLLSQRPGLDRHRTLRGLLVSAAIFLIALSAVYWVY